MRRCFVGISYLLIFLLNFISMAPVKAEVIQFPKEDLATESVLPVFDRPDVVRHRTVSLSKRIELGVLMGYALTEPFYNPLQFGGTATYHINEVHGINIFASTYLSGLSNEGRQLRNVKGGNGLPLDYRMEYGPTPKAMVIGSWQYTAFYGKLSFTKNYVMNLHLYGLLGGGMYSVGDSSVPVISAGLGQKFHFTPSISLRFDLRTLAFMGPDPVSARLDGVTQTKPNSAFKEKFMLEGLLNVGLSYTLPSL